MTVITISLIWYLMIGSLYYAIRQALGKASGVMALPMILGWPWFVIDSLLGGTKK